MIIEISMDSSDLPRQFQPNQNVMIGAASSCDLILHGSKIADQHALLVHGSTGWTVHDLNSSTGIIVNNIRVQNALLHEGDRLQLGGVALTIHYRWPDVVSPAAVTSRNLGRFGSIVLDDLIYKGRTGWFYRGRWETKNNRLVAVKVFTPLFSRDEEMLYRFCRGVTQAGEFRHPNIVRLYRGGKQNNRWFLAMEWMARGSLRDELSRIPNQSIPLVAAKKIGISICRALETAHAKDLIHRNISPSSVLLDESGEAKLGDFVLVRDADIDANHQLTVTGQLLTQDITYLAPEHALGRQNVDIRSDIYSLGATLYHALTGRPPVEGKNLAELLVNIARKRPAPPLGIFNPLVPKSLEEAIQRSLAHDPRDRFQTPEEFRDALNAAD